LHCYTFHYQIKRTNDLWQQLPTASESAQACLNALATEQTQLEREIQDYMKANAYSQQSSSTTLSSSSSHADNNTAANSAIASESAYVSAAPVVVPFANKLPMPMSSPLIKYASVLQRKHEGVVKKSWAPCLVVMTVDRFLYVFDIKSHSDIDSSNNGAATAKPDEQHTQNTSGSSSSSDNATASTAAAAVAAIAAHTIGALSVEAAFDAILPHIDIKEPFK
jgi:hypothetical protein